MDKSFSETYLNFQQVSWDTLKEAINDTLFMTIVSMLIVFVLGLLLGLLLYSLGRKHSRCSQYLIWTSFNSQQYIPINALYDFNGLDYSIY